MLRTHSELVRIESFEDRLKYLSLNGIVGNETFGTDRYLNQMFYKSKEWRKVRDTVIIRDKGCDLGVLGFEIFSKILVHHINPICSDDILDYTETLLNPEYLITVSIETHNAIHYGDCSVYRKYPAERTKWDTCPWKI